MTNTHDLSTFYSTRIAPHLASLEQERRRVIGYRYALMAIVFAVLSSILISYIFAPAWIGFPIAASVICCLGAAFLSARIGVDLANRVKSVFVNETAYFLNLIPGNRTTGEPITLGTFQRYGILPTGNESSIEDHFHGHKDGLEIDIADTVIKSKTTTRDSDGKTKTTTTLLFRGPVFRISYNRPLKAQIVLVKDWGKFINLLNRFTIAGERVHIEDPKFEEYFEVYATDQIEARYILTPSFIERLISLSDHVQKRPLGIAFHEGFIYVTLNTGVDWFEPGSLWTSLMDLQRVERLVQQLGLVFNMIQILNLAGKTRI
ncbi:MAG: DUF3137 domain-containing protein [Alphaproteobacteria bacterium]